MLVCQSLSRTRQIACKVRSSTFHRNASTTPESILTPSSSTKTTNPAPGAPKPNSPFIVFDRGAKHLQRNRAATRNNGQASRLTDYIRDEAAANLSERLLDVKRNFETIVDLGSGAGYLRRHLKHETTGTKKVIMCDTSESALYRDVDEDENYPCECNYNRHSHSRGKIHLST